METRADNACVHLGRPGLPHHCSIYEIRPDICGEFERGGWQCLEARRFSARAEAERAEAERAQSEASARLAGKAEEA